MKPVFEFNALFNTVLVYRNRVVLRPSMLQKIGGIREKEIFFDEISEVSFQEASMLVRGLMFFAIRGEKNQKPPSILMASNAENTFVFRHGNNSEAIQIKKYIDSQRKNPPSLLRSAKDMGAHKVVNVKPPTPCNSGDFYQYRKLTAEGDWNAIFEFNNLTSEVVGVGKELRVLRKYLQDDEVVFALTAGVISQTTTSNVTDFGLNTWLGVLTDRRILLLDHAMLSDSVDTQSIRHDRIQAVSSSQGWMFGKISIDIGNRSIVIDNCDKNHVKTFSRIANDWLEHLAGRVETDSIKPRKDAMPDRDPINEIKRLSELKDSGILSEEEFARAKASLLSKM